MTPSLTTAQVARLCSVSAATVQKWCNTGMLRSWRLPGSSHRRVERRDLDRFAAKHELPLGEGVSI